MNFDDQYRSITLDILAQGQLRRNRTGIDTVALPAAMVSHDLANGFPLLTLKKVPFKMVAVELEGFIHGITDKRWYQERGCSIWDEWCSPARVPYGTDEDTRARMKAEPDLGPIYGAQWRNFGGFDQLAALIFELENNPDSRRLVCSAWNPPQICDMALPPCHVMWQVLVINGELNLNWYQRSADWFLGVPFNMASYALLASIIAADFGFKPRRVTGFFGDTHLYANQIEAAKLLASRAPRPAPRLEFLALLSPDTLRWTHDNAQIWNYTPHPAIKVEVAV